MIKVLDKPHLDLTTPIGRGFIAFLSALAEDGRQRIVPHSWAIAHIIPQPGWICSLMNSLCEQTATASSFRGSYISIAGKKPHGRPARHSDRGVLRPRQSTPDLRAHMENR